MTAQKNISDILLAEDDDIDFDLIKDAFKVTGLGNRVQRAIDGEEALELIFHPERAPMRDFLPGLVILDLNMPKKNGMEVLREIKSHASTRQLPVVILTTSSEQEDITQSYNYGANSFIIKPTKFQDLVDILDTTTQYWLNIVKLPKRV